MTEDTSGSLSPPLQSASAGRQEALALWAIGIGFALATVGLVVGLTMAFKQRETQCADGTYLPEGTTDFRCFAHPHALDGTAIAVFSLMLGIDRSDRGHRQGHREGCAPGQPGVGQQL